MLVKKILALFGFAPRAEQAVVPPYFAHLGIIAAGYFGGTIVELITRAMQLHWTIGAGVRSFGVVASLLAAHSAYRVVVHGDEYSWGGVIRRLFYR